MFALPPTPIRLHPTLGHVRVQVCRTGISFEERFANPMHKRCKIVSCVTVGKIRTIQSKTWVIADPERSKSGLRQKSTLGQRDASSRFVLRDFQNSRSPCHKVPISLGSAQLAIFLSVTHTFAQIRRALVPCWQQLDQSGVGLVSVLAKMTGYRCKQGINGLSLDSVGWPPEMPGCRGMFRKDQLGFMVQKTQKVADLFFKALVARLWVLNFVEQVELKFWVDIDRIGRNASFFLSFPKCRFQKRFSFIAMTFRKVPAGWVTHEQKLHRICRSGHQ